MCGLIRICPKLWPGKIQKLDNSVLLVGLLLRQMARQSAARLDLHPAGLEPATL
jgi:hypothetical protein